MIAIHTPLTGKFLHREVCDVGFLWISMFLLILSLSSFRQFQTFHKKKEKLCAPIHNYMHPLTPQSSSSCKRKRRVKAWLTSCVWYSNTLSTHAVELCLMFRPFNHWWDYTHRSLFRESKETDRSSRIKPDGEMKLACRENQSTTCRKPALSLIYSKILACKIKGMYAKWQAFFLCSNWTIQSYILLLSKVWYTAY